MMNDSSDLKKDEMQSKKAHQGRLEELVTEVCAQLLSAGELKHLEEQSKNSDAESALKQRLTIKHLVKKFLENTEKTMKTLENDSNGGSDREGNTSEKDDITVNKTCSESKNKLNISKENEKLEISVTSQTSADEEKDVKPPLVIQREETIESKNNVKTIKDEEEKNILRYEISEAGIMFNNILLKTESSCEFDNTSNEISLTSDEEQEIKRLILLEESNHFETLAVKNEREDGGSTLNEENNHFRECLKFESSLCYSSDKIKKTDGSAEAGEPIKVHVSTDSAIPPILCDKKGPFYIRHNRMRIPLKYYEDNLLNHRWSPTAILYELCVQCNWSRPEFRLIDYSKNEGYWYSVKVNNLNFVSYRKSISKKQAKNLASARFFRFLGYQYKYMIFSKAECLRRYAPWSEKYSNYNSISLASEEERLGLGYNYDLGEPETYDNKRKRSRSRSRNQKIRRISSPESDHRMSKMICDDREGRTKCRRRDSTLERSSHRDTKLHMDQEGREHRKPRLVHKRISVTHVYDRESPSSSR